MWKGKGMGRERKGKGEVCIEVGRLRIGKELRRKGREGVKVKMEV